MSSSYRCSCILRWVCVCSVPYAVIDTMCVTVPVSVTAVQASVKLTAENVDVRQLHRVLRGWHLVGRRMSPVEDYVGAAQLLSTFIGNVLSTTYRS